MGVHLAYHPPRPAARMERASESNPANEPEPEPEPMAPEGLLRQARPCVEDPLLQGAW